MDTWLSEHASGAEARRVARTAEDRPLTDPDADGAGGQG